MTLPTMTRQWSTTARVIRAIEDRDPGDGHWSPPPKPWRWMCSCGASGWADSKEEAERHTRAPS